MTTDRCKVLVTGAGGFVGSHLVRDRLARGNAVIATDVDLQRLEALNLEGDLSRERLDILDSERLSQLLNGVDTVFHLAAAHLDVLKGEDYFHEVNVDATRMLARRSAQAGVRRFVHCSTVGVYGPLENLPADETTLPKPDIAYERSKLEGEAAIRSVIEETGLEAVILRPAWVYGPLCPRTQKLIRTVARKRFFFVGDGSNRRHPIYITDMLEAFQLAAVQPAPSGEIVIIAGPDTVSVKELIRLIIDELGMGYAPPRLPTWFMGAACLAVEKGAGLVGREPPFSRRSLKFFSESSAFNIAKAEQLLGFRPKVNTREGLRLTIREYSAQGIL
ncbi:NAD-dependent epimerase/dehydratase family protein [Thioalkalivibrio sp.]|uniref:NAD-dependent epimerase/dehydratase family protein n=1 Tax=Thioalkalivibrio sp. TaxID=2093813 RepID=UPI00356502EC